MSITQRLAEANQVRFGEEFFIPPRMKQTYIQKATDTYFNQVMYQTNNAERHTVAGPYVINPKKKGDAVARGTLPGT